MPIRIQSAIYQNLPGQNPTFQKFDTYKHSIVGSAVYMVAGGQCTGWNWTLLVSSSASALGGGLSAGGLDTLRASFALPTAIQIVTDEAITAMAYFRSLKTQRQLNPTIWEIEVSFEEAD